MSLEEMQIKSQLNVSQISSHYIVTIYAYKVYFMYNEQNEAVRALLWYSKVKFIFISTFLKNKNR